VGSHRTDPWAPAPNPVDSVTLRVRAMERGNGGTRWWLSARGRVEEVPTGCLSAGGMLEEAKARGAPLGPTWCVSRWARGQEASRRPSGRPGTGCPRCCEPTQRDKTGEKAITRACQARPQRRPPSPADPLVCYSGKWSRGEERTHVMRLLPCHTVMVANGSRVLPLARAWHSLRYLPLHEGSVAESYTHRSARGGAPRNTFYRYE
jgi:hypothetical protein